MPPVFCAYCGKSFTRKEHLERHIPSHTNVKPHRCSYCHLSFARRDLLQRHHSTYHEAKDSMQTSPNGSSPQVGGRTPIACLSCASAKTGCDKKVPCSRCAEKNLPCAARYARRSSKAAAARAANPAQNSPVQFSGVRYMDLDKANLERLSLDHISPQMSPLSTEHMFDISQHQSPLQKCYPFSPEASMMGPNTMGCLSPNRLTGIDEFIQLNTDMVNQEPVYHDLLSWTDFPLDVEMYTTNTPTAHNGLQGLTFSESEITSGTEASTRTSLSSSHTRSTSILSAPDREPPPKSQPFQAQWASETMVPEFEVVIAAEASWPLARCTPLVFSSSCPRTAIVHLESLEQNSKLENPWKSLELHLDQILLDQDNKISIEPLSPGTRDKMLAITQTFLHKALDIHRNGINGWSKNSPSTFNYLVLPPSNVLESFLKSYVRSLSCYYTLIAGGTVDPNELMMNTQASTLLVLLMIAQGATAFPTVEARYLIAGLTETCRISLFDIIEKDVELSADPTVLRCALLFTILGVWSGDKWHMDIAMGQRGMYLAMLKHAGMLEPKRLNTPSFNNCISPELQWREWLQYENTNRLVYNWVMVDQELSLFHDTAPILSITEIQNPMPGAERLWLAKDSREWINAFQETYNYAEGPNSPNFRGPQTQSLCDLFQDLLHDNLDLQQSQLSPLELKLLLHPLQSLLCHLRQVLSCFSDTSGSRRGTRTVTKASTLLRLEEVQRLLQAWYDLCIVHEKSNPSCAITKANLVLYHLISLNAVTSFPEMERLARKEAFDGTYWDLSMKIKRCIYQPEEAIYHCGQVIRLIRLMPRHSRPQWWSAAIYRVTIILWVESMSHIGLSHLESSPATHFSNGSPTTISNPRQISGPPVAIDALTPEHPSVAKFLWNGEGVPMLTKRDGTMTGLEEPLALLAHCIGVLDEGVAQRLSDGIKRKLQSLLISWSSEPLQMQM